MRRRHDGRADQSTDERTGKPTDRQFLFGVMRAHLKKIVSTRTDERTGEPRDRQIVPLCGCMCVGASEKDCKRTNRLTDLETDG